MYNVKECHERIAAVLTARNNKSYILAELDGCEFSDVREGEPMT